MAVPKPINLPSRRAENNGFDPNVQLVPGGSWAAPAGKPSQSASSASNVQSQKAEASDAPPTSSASRVAWSVQQTAAPPRPVAPNVNSDFPKLGVVPQAPVPGLAIYQCAYSLVAKYCGSCRDKQVPAGSTSKKSARAVMAGRAESKLER